MRYIIIFFSAVLLSSCVSVQQVQIEVLKPSTVKLRPVVRKVGLVNITSGQHYTHYSKEKRKNLGSAQDTLKQRLVDYCIMSFYDLAVKSGRFDSIMLIQIDNDLKLADAKDLAVQYKLDGLIVLSHISLNVDRSLYRVYPYQRIIEPDHEDMISEMLVSFKAIWRLYDLGQHEFSDNIVYDYDKSWRGEGKSKREALASLPAEPSLAENLFYSAGIYAANKMIPSWVPEVRSFYVNSNNDFLLAAEKVQEKDWNAARELWGKYETSDNRFLARQALYNLALAKEIEGELEAAESLSKAVYRDYNDYMAKTYADILHKRIIDQYHLKRQIK